MDEATLTALKGSIAKWEGIVAGACKDRGAENCALCDAFNGDDANCEGCPVALKTGESNCIGTPWQQWAAEHFDPSGDIDIDGGWAADTPKRKKIAQAELDFLKSLLPLAENP